MAEQCLQCIELQSGDGRADQRSGRWLFTLARGQLSVLCSDVVESTLVTDVSEPCRLSDVSWIKPGVVSWIYWLTIMVQEIIR